MDFTALQQFMEHLTAWRIPGNAVSVCLNGREVFSGQSGYADVEKKIPMTPEHYINIYSCSKVATVTAALQLYEQGRFRLDDPLYEFIPEYREMYVAHPDGVRRAENPITLRHLFTMTWPQLNGYGYGLGVRTLVDQVASGSTGNLGEFGWGGAAGATVLIDPQIGLSVFYAHHMLNPQESYYQPRLRNVVYDCL